MEEHTGDIKLKARGVTHQELFANAAKGMMVFLYGEEILNKQTDQAQAVSITSSDPEALLVDWLSELLYLSNTHYRAYLRFHFSALDSTHLEAEVGSVEAEAVDDIKAVTYHQLSIKQRDDHWEATIVFDI